MRFVCLVLLGSGCAYISDKHEEWRLDPDGDGVSIEVDCDNDDAEVGGPQPWYVDQDEDGYGVEEDVTYDCDPPSGYAAESGDCDDFDSTVFPTAKEQCDGADNNCNGLSDEDLPVVDVYVDADGDGFGDPATGEERCGVMPGFVVNATDCDDDNPYFREEGLVEIPYNGFDDNCDDSDGDGDQDRDTYWAADYVERVEGDPMPVPEGKGDDCDDEDETIHPLAADTWYDGVDSDCGGEDDCDIDGDGFVPAVDGFCAPLPGEMVDCDDHRADINPDAEEVCDEDGEDEDCDGDTNEADVLGCEIYYSDFDSDTYGDTESGVCQCEAEFPLTVRVGGDCDESDVGAFYYPGAFDPPYDGEDMDCAGDDDFDYDGDGYVPDAYAGLLTSGVEGSGLLPGGDCDDEDGTIHPGAVDVIADGIDTDCDGVEFCYVDMDGDGHAETTGLTWASREPDCSEAGAAPIGAPADDCVDSDPSYYPGAPDAWYDGEDSDCAENDDFDQDGDGHSDRDYGEPSDTFWLDAGVWILVEDATEGRVSAGDCDDTDAAISPDEEELCDGIDNDCNDEIDEGAIDTITLYADSDGDGHGDPDLALSIEGCPVEGYVVTATDCDDADAGAYPGAEEACDAVDSDCDGDLVDGFADLDLDAVPDCVEPPAVGALAHTLAVGIAGSRAGQSLLVGVEGTLYVGAPGMVDDRARVYVLEELTDASIDLEASAALLTRSAEDFGYSFAELSGDSGPRLIVGSPDENAIIRVDTPMVGHEVSFVPGGDPSGDTFAFLAAVPVPGSEERCGHALSTAEWGDLGAEDVLVGCPLRLNGGFSVHDSTWDEHGRFTEMDAEGVGTGVAYNEEFGYSIAVGDIDADGIDDALIGSRHDDYFCVGSNCGAAYVYLGPIDTPVSFVGSDAVVYGDEEADSMGANVEVVDDLDGDGVQDVLISTNHGFSLSGSPKEGAVVMFSGTSLTSHHAESEATHVFLGTEIGSQFGFDAAILPDVDGDGQGELLVGAYAADHETVDSGAVYGFRGEWLAGGGVRTIDDPGVTRIQGSEGGQLGFKISVGDVGADGEVDVVISEHGRDQLWVLSPAVIFGE